MKIGSIKISSGKICVASTFSGYRPGLTLKIGSKEIRQYLLTLMIREQNPLLQSRYQYWINELGIYPNKEDLNKILKDMRNRFDEQPKNSAPEKKSKSQEKREKRRHFAQTQLRQYSIYEIMDWLTKLSYCARSGKPEHLYPNEEL